MSTGHNHFKYEIAACHCKAANLNIFKNFPDYFAKKL